MEPLASPCPCSESKESYTLSTHVNIRLKFSDTVSFEAIFNLLKQLPEHELTGIELSKW